MKRILLATYLAAAAAASAADLKLADGRVFKDYQITSQTPTAVVVRHAGGAAKVEKRLLPSAVLKQYPIDEKAAAAEAAEIEKGKAIYEAQRRAQEEKRGGSPNPKKPDPELEAAKDAGRREAELAAAREAGRREVTDAEAERARQQALIEAHNERQAGKVSGVWAEKIAAAVRSRADTYFKSQYKRPASALTVELHVDLEEPRGVPGWSGRYEVVGQAWWQALESKGGVSADRSWFRATVELKNGAARVTEFVPLSSEPLR